MTRHRRRVAWALTLALGLSSTALCAQAAAVDDAPASPPIDADLATAIDELFAAYDVPGSPGCAIGVVERGVLRLARGYGLANLEHSVPNSATAVYYIGSTSKQFVAAGIFLAARQGHLALDDSLRSHLAELPAWADRITIRQLMHHTSGIRDYLALMYVAGLPYENVHTRDAIIELLSRQRDLNFEPGSEWLYSNSGYFLMAVVLERATGRSLRQFTVEEIFQPLGMDHTHFHDDRRMIVPNRAAAYARADESDFELDWFLNFEQVGSGGLMTTVEDLAKWDANFYSDRLGDGTLVEALLSPGALASGQELPYGGGLGFSEHRGHRTVGHGGAFMGFRSELLRFPDLRLAVICLCNVSDANPGALALEVADLVIDAGELKGSQLTQGEPAETPPAATASSQPQVVEVTATDVAGPSEPESPEASLTPLRLSSEQLQRWAGVYREIGGTLVRRIRVDGDGLVYVRTHDSRTPLEPLAEDSFRMLGTSVPIAVTFDPPTDDVATTTMLVDVRGEEPSVFELLALPALSAEQLAEYAGDYTSVELDTTYRVRPEGAGLAIQVGDFQDPIAVTALTPDSFEGDGFAIRFTRKNERIRGFSLTAGRIRDIWFKRRGGARGPGPRP